MRRFFEDIMEDIKHFFDSNILLENSLEKTIATARPTAESAKIAEKS